MKKILLSFCLLGAVYNSQAQNNVKPTNQPVATVPPPASAPAAASPVLFEKVKHSFGKIPQGTPKTYTFSLKNVGSKALIIEQATAQCGCTTPEYPKTPIAKGKSSSIKVTYNAAAPGAFTKTVTVKFLGIPQPTILTIDGEVLKKPEAPKN